MAGPLETVFDRGPAHLLGPHENGLVYAFLASAQGTEAFRHKQLFALRGVLNMPTKPIDLGPSYIGCLVPDFPCRQLMHKTSASADSVVRLGRAILEICRPLHERDLTHGCISAERILLTREAGLVIRDCGAISATAMHTRGLIQAQMPGLDRLFPPHGTVPPEFLRGETSSSRTDIFLIGVLLYELLTGRTPFEAPSTLARYHRISKGDFNPLGAAYGELGQWVNQCLESSPSKRPSPKESLDLLMRLESPGSYEELFASQDVPLSSTLSGLPAPHYSEPFLASDPENAQTLKLWDAQLLARRGNERKHPQKRRWGSWLAVAFIAVVTWIFIEMVTTEMRSQSYDGRPGPAPQSTLRNKGEVTPHRRAKKRRPLDRGERLPRRTISL